MLKKQKEKNRNHHQLQYNRERKNTITKIIKGPPPKYHHETTPVNPSRCPSHFCISPFNSDPLGCLSKYGTVVAT